MAFRDVSHYVRVALVIIICYIIQTTIIKYISIRGITPNLVYIAIIYYCISVKDVKVMFVCLICGLFVDILGSMPFGTNGILYMLIGTMIAFVAGKYFSANIIIVVATVLLASFAYELTVFVVLKAMWGKGDFFNNLVFIVFPICFYNGIISIIVYPILHQIFSRQE